MSDILQFVTVSHEIGHYELCNKQLWDAWQTVCSINKFWYLL